MDMIGHDGIACNTVVICFQVIDPPVNQIITVGLLYQPEPLMAGKSDKIQSFIIWHGPAYRHSIKLAHSLIARSLLCPN